MVSSIHWRTEESLTVSPVVWGRDTPALKGKGTCMWAEADSEDSSFLRYYFDPRNWLMSIYISEGSFLYPISWLIQISLSYPKLLNSRAEWVFLPDEINWKKCAGFSVKLLKMLCLDTVASTDISPRSLRNITSIWQDRYLDTPFSYK